MIRNLLMRWWLPVLVIPVLTLGVYLNSNVLNSPFLFDDDHVIQKNLQVRNPEMANSLRQAFMARSLVTLTFALNFRTSGLNPMPYHVTNIAIHLINCLIVIALIHAVLSMPGILVKQEVKQAVAGFGALMFGLHPIQTQAVIFISQRFTLMAAGFYMLSALCYLKARHYQISHARTAHPFPVLLFAGTFVFWACALMSKQNSASLPLMLLAAEFILVDGSWTVWKKRIPWLLGAAVTLFLAGLFLAGAFKGSWSAQSILARLDMISRETGKISRWDYLCTQFQVIILYLKLILWPSGLHLEWQYPFSRGLFDGYSLHALVLLLLIMAAAAKLRKAQPVICFGITWFFIALVVESSVFPIQDALFEHRVYLPLTGLLIAFNFFLIQFAVAHWKAGLILAPILCMVLGTAAWKRTEAWKSEIAVWKDSAEKSPENPKALINLGMAYGKAGQYDRAYDALMETVKIEPKASRAYLNLGNIYRIRKQYGKAVAMFRQTIALNPFDALAFHNLGCLYMDLGKLDLALIPLKKAVQLRRSDPVYPAALGKLYIRREEYGKAHQTLKALVDRFPDYSAENYAYLAQSCAHIGKSHDEVSGYIERARKMGFTRWELIMNDPILVNLLGRQQVEALNTAG